MPRVFAIAVSAALLLLLASVAAGRTSSEIHFPVADAPSLRRRLSSAQDTSPLQYGLLIDAGSSGSRLAIFSWDARVFSVLPPSLSVPIERVSISSRTAPGIDKPAGRAALKPMLAQAVSFLESLGVPEERLALFPLFLTATAGMRILDATARNSAIEATRDVLEDSPFLFQRPWARVISGEAEGVYGWLAANFEAQTLFSSPESGSPSDVLLISNTTIGSVDLGGASSQLAFLPPDGGDLLAGAYPLQLTTTARTIAYVHSFLYYGAGEGTARINELVLSNYASQHLGQAIAPGAIIPHPCFLNGTSPSAAGFVSTSVFPGLSVVFQGTSDAAACYALASKLMLRETQCLTDPKPTPALVQGSVTIGADAASTVDGLPLVAPKLFGTPNTTCSIDGVYQPALPSRLMAFSFYSYLYSFLGIPSGSPLSALLDAVNSFCSLDFATANATFFFRTTLPSAIPSYCLTGSYASALLAVGFKVPTDAAGLVLVNTTSSVGYSTGAMLVAVNQLAWSYQQGDDPQIADLNTRLAQAREVAGALGAILALGLIAVVWTYHARKKEEVKRERELTAAFAAASSTPEGADLAAKIAVSRGPSRALLVTEKQRSTLLGHAYAPVAGVLHQEGPASLHIDSSLRTGLLQSPGGEHSDAALPAPSEWK